MGRQNIRWLQSWVDLPSDREDQLFLLECLLAMLMQVRQPLCHLLVLLRVAVVPLTSPTPIPSSLRIPCESGELAEDKPFSGLLYLRLGVGVLAAAEGSECLTCDSRLY